MTGADLRDADDDELRGRESMKRDHWLIGVRLCLGQVLVKP